MKHRMIILSRFIVIVAVLLVAVACHDDDEPSSWSGDNELKFSETQVDVGYRGRYCTLSVAGLAEDDSIVTVAPSADWVEYEEVFGNNLLLYIQPNESMRRREATVTVVSARGVNSTISVLQHSSTEDDTNALDEDSLSRIARVGYGYNLLYDYADMKSVSADPVFDYQALAAAERDYGTIIGQEPNNHIDYKYYTSYTIYEMATRLMKEQTSSTSFLGLSKKVSRYTSVKEYDSQQQCYGYAKFTKIVASRYLDMGKVDELLRQPSRLKLFTPAFAEWVKKLEENPSDRDAVAAFVSTYGSHVIIYADLGGRLDYEVNFMKHEVNREEMERYMKTVLGQERVSEATENTSHSVEKAGNVHADVFGGDPALGQMVKNRIVTYDVTHEQLDPAGIAKWSASIDINSPQHLTMANCRFIPIWQLFSSFAAQDAVRRRILDLAEGLTNQKREELGLNNYIALGNVRNLQGFDGAKTLARVGYNKGIPKFEICNEYVPELRADRRVTIIYPIYNKLTNIRHGIFPGDGENTPSEVSFDDNGGIYVQPLEECKPGDVLDSLFYIDGAIYATSYGVTTKPCELTVRDEWLEIPGHPNYPVVKIGPTFWIRQNVADELGFGILYDDYGYEEWEYRESVYDDSGKSVLYAEIFNPLDDNKVNTLKVGSEEDRWYLPSDVELEAMTRYIGKNPKALFTGQQTGFDATFDGCEMDYDFVDCRWLIGFTLLYRGERCFIAFKRDRSRTAKDGTALMLMPDYSLTEIPINQEYNCRYPVRFCRSYLYKHDNL